MLLIIGTIRLPAAKLDAAKDAIAAMILASRAEPGCLAYHYAPDLLDEGLVHVKEIWRDKAALERHFASAHLAQWRAAWPALGIAERSLRLYEIGEGEAI